jgi:Domain of unknown function (DUF3883)
MPSRIQQPAQLTIVFAAETAERDDYHALQKSADGMGKTPWSALKSTQAGDRILIYCRKPHGALVARAVAMQDAKPGKYWSFETKLGEIRMIDPAITREAIQSAFPKWPWAKSTRGQTAVPAEIADPLWDWAMAGSEAVKEPTITIHGAGFGNPAENAEKETAAVRRVTKELKAKGYQVVSREKEKIGYDLEATKGGTQLHVEVKGIAGVGLEFPITAGEVRRAESDPAFRLFAVTEVLSGKPKLHEFTGETFLTKFDLRALAYMAVRK